MPFGRMIAFLMVVPFSLFLKKKMVKHGIME